MPHPSRHPNSPHPQIIHIPHPDTPPPEFDLGYTDVPLDTGSSTSIDSSSSPAADSNDAGFLGVDEGRDKIPESGISVEKFDDANEGRADGAPAIEPAIPTLPLVPSSRRLGSLASPRTIRIPHIEPPLERGWITEEHLGPESVDPADQGRLVLRPMQRADEIIEGTTASGKHVVPNRPEIQTPTSVQEAEVTPEPDSPVGEKTLQERIDDAFTQSQRTRLISTSTHPEASNITKGITPELLEYSKGQHALVSQPEDTPMSLLDSPDLPNVVTVTTADEYKTLLELAYQRSGCSPAEAPRLAKTDFDHEIGHATPAIEAGLTVRYGIAFVHSESGRGFYPFVKLIGETTAGRYKQIVAGAPDPSLGDKVALGIAHEHPHASPIPLQDDIPKQTLRLRDALGSAWLPKEA